MVKYTILFFCSFLNSSVYAQRMGVKMSEGELPNTTLDVNGSFAFREASPLPVANGDNHNLALDSMSFYRISAPTAAFAISGFTGGGNGRILRIANTTAQVMTLKHQNTNTTAANRLRLPNGNDLEIGTNGTVTLQYSAGLNRWLVVGFTGASSNSLNAWGLTGNSNTNPSSNFIGTTDNVGLGLRTNNTEIVRITEGGNVGIGTTAPTSKLHIVGGDNTPTVNSATTNVLSRLTNSAGGSVVQTLETITSTGTRGIRIGINPTAATCSTPGLITFQAHSTLAGDNSVSDIIEYSFTDRNLILLPWTTNATRNVGIGINAPTEKLHVIGNILASGTITPSDARFKENITTLTGALTKIKQLRGVSYTHKTTFIKDRGLQQGNQIGFIAQELEQIFPEFVVTSADGYKAVDYARLTPVLVESLKEVNAKLEAQQAEINELKAAVKQLMNKR